MDINGRYFASHDDDDRGTGFSLELGVTYLDFLSSIALRQTSFVSSDFVSFTVSVIYWRFLIQSQLFGIRLL